MRVVNVDPSEDQLWDVLVSSKDSDVFNSPPWLRVLGRSYGFDLKSAIVVDEANNPTSGVAYCRVDGVRGERVSSLPFSDYCDPLIDTADDWERLKPALEHPSLPTTLRVLHNTVVAEDPGLERAGEAAWHAVDLDRSVEDIWASLDSGARRAIRKAEGSGVKTRESTDIEDLETFFSMHLRVRKYRHRLLAQPYRFFEAIHEEFFTGGSGFLMLSEVDDQMVGGIVFLVWKDRLYYKLNAWESDFSKNRPNDAAMWAGVERGVELGLKRLDLGLSDIDQDGLVRYKRKYATTEKRIQILTTGPATERRELAFVPDLVEMLTSSEVPDAVTKRSGDLLYHLFA